MQETDPDGSVFLHLAEGVGFEPAPASLTPGRIGRLRRPRSIPEADRYSNPLERLNPAWYWRGSERREWDSNLLPLSPQPRRIGRLRRARFVPEADRYSNPRFLMQETDPDGSVFLHLAEGVGFEPTEVLPQRFSRPSPSSARPSLLVTFPPTPGHWPAVPSPRKRGD